MNVRTAALNTGAADAGRYAKKMKTNERLNATAAVALCGIPLINYFYVIVFWLFASAALGEQALPGVHDPKGFFYGIPAAIEPWLLIASYGVAPLVVYLGYKQRKLTSYTIAYATCLVIAIALFRMDFWQTTTWIAD